MDLNLAEETLELGLSRVLAEPAVEAAGLANGGGSLREVGDARREGRITAARTVGVVGGTNAGEDAVNGHERPVLLSSTRRLSQQCFFVINETRTAHP